MGAGSSILHSIWKIDFYHSVKEEENTRNNYLKDYGHHRYCQDYPDPIVCPIQYSKYYNHLNDLPKGEESQNQLGMIRLINKRKFFRLPIIHWMIRQYLEVLLHFECIIQKKYNGTTGDDSDPESHSLEDNNHHPTTTSPSSSSNAVPLDYEYRSGVKSKYAYNVYKNIEEEVSTISKALKKLLIWHRKGTNFTDAFCELYPINAHPKFTYVSHRWVEDGTNPFGLHNELILFLLLVKEDYLWLDCTCIPQPDSIITPLGAPLTTSHETDNSVVMKLIWNIGKIMDEASNIATYYAVDGWKTGLLPPAGTSNGLSNTTIGFLRLYQCLFSSFIPVHTHEAISELHNDGSSRAWCYIEQRWKNKQYYLNPIDYHGNAFLSDYTRERFRYKKKKSLQDLNLHSTSSTITTATTTNNNTAVTNANTHHSRSQSRNHSFTNIITPRSLGGSGGGGNGSGGIIGLDGIGIDSSSILLSFQEHRKLHLENIFSLNCSNYYDLIPITTLLYQSKLLPFVYRNGSFVCSVKRNRPRSAVNGTTSHPATSASISTKDGEEGGSMEWVNGFRLPALSAVRENRSYDLEGRNEGSYGWYRCPIYDEKQETIRTRYYFALHSSRFDPSSDDSDDHTKGISSSHSTQPSSSTMMMTIIPKKERNYDYLVLMIHEECLDYCSQYYELEYLPYDHMNELHSYFLKYSQAYDWNHYDSAHCQLCALKERLVDEEEHEGISHGKGGKSAVGGTKEVGIKRLPQRSVVKLSVNPHHRR